MKSISIWRFYLPLAFQAFLILAVPVQATYTYISGRTVILQTRPIDPYDLLRGYSQTLNYDISNESNLELLPGWNTLVEKDASKTLPLGTQFYVILEEPKASTQGTKSPKPWKPIAINRDRPTNLLPNQVILQGRKSDYPWIEYGLETYYFPEEQRESINKAISKMRQNSLKNTPFVVEIKVDSQGKAVPVSLWIEDHNYRF